MTILRFRLQKRKNLMFIYSEVRNILEISYKWLWLTGKKVRVYKGFGCDVPNEGLLNVTKVFLSPSLSVVTVLFDVTFLNQKISIDDQRSKIEAVRRKIIHSIPYLRGRLTQEAGLKYAPELRFFPYRLGGSTTQIFVRFM